MQKNSTIELIHCTALYNPVAEDGKLSIFSRFVLVRVTRSMTREYNNADLFFLYWTLGKSSFFSDFFLKKTKNWKVNGDSGSSLFFMLDCNEWFSSNRIPMFCAQDSGIARGQTLRVATKKCMAWCCFCVKSSVFGHRMPHFALILWETGVTNVGVLKFQVSVWLMRKILSINTPWGWVWNLCSLNLHRHEEFEEKVSKYIVQI